MTFSLPGTAAFFKGLRSHDPTVGASPSSFGLSDLSFEIVELGGMLELREMWDVHYAKTRASSSI